MGERLQHISAHDGIRLLQNSFSIPKLLPLYPQNFFSSTLITYNVLLKSITSSITNIRFIEDDPAWSQATLPDKFGGLGFRSTV